MVVNVMAVFRKGAGGRGHIIEFDAARGIDHSGPMAMSFDYISSTDAGRVRLSTASKKQSEEDQRGSIVLSKQ